MAAGQRAKYGFGITLHDSFENAVGRVKEAFRSEGFGTLSEMDVTRTLREKIEHEIEPYTILGMCNPHLASQAIGIEHEIGLLLPCNVLVHACGGGVSVSVQDPELMLELTGNERLQPIAAEARRRLQRALTSLEAP